MAPHSNSLFLCLSTSPAEDEMVGGHHRLNGHEFEQTPGDSEREGSLVCCNPWGSKELNVTEWLNKSNYHSPWRQSFDCMNGLLFLLSISGWRQSCKLELSKSSLHAAPRQPFFCVRFLLPMATPSLVHARSNSRSELQQCPLRAGSPPTSCLSPCQVNQPTAARVFSKPHSPLAGGDEISRKGKKKET